MILVVFLAAAWMVILGPVLLRRRYRARAGQREFDLPLPPPAPHTGARRPRADRRPGLPAPLRAHGRRFRRPTGHRHRPPGTPRAHRGGSGPAPAPGPGVPRGCARGGAPRPERRRRPRGTSGTTAGPCRRSRRSAPGVQAAQGHPHGAGLGLRVQRHHRGDPRGRVGPGRGPALGSGARRLRGHAGPPAYPRRAAGADVALPGSRRGGVPGRRVPVGRSRRARRRPVVRVSAAR